MPPGRPKKSAGTEPTGNRFVRAYNFDPVEFKAFEERSARLGTSPSAIFRKVVTDFLAGRYVHFDTLRPGTEDELKKKAAEFNTDNMQFVIESLLNEWAEKRRQ